VWGGRGGGGGGGAVAPKKKYIYIYLVRSINQESSQYARKLGSLSGRNIVCVISGESKKYIVPGLSRGGS